MQKHALKRYKIKQMFIFTLTKIAICYKILISVIFERIVVTMGLTLTEKILKAHLVDGEFVKGMPCRKTRRDHRKGTGRTCGRQTGAGCPHEQE